MTQKNPGRSVRKRTRTLILVEVEDEEVVELLQRLTMRDLKKRKNVIHIVIHSS